VRLEHLLGGPRQQLAARSGRQAARADRPAIP
jgi:hypothetical protein